MAWHQWGQDIYSYSDNLLSLYIIMAWHYKVLGHLHPLRLVQQLCGSTMYLAVTWLLLGPGHKQLHW